MEKVLETCWVVDVIGFSRIGSIERVKMRSEFFQGWHDTEISDHCIPLFDGVRKKVFLNRSVFMRNYRYIYDASADSLTVEVCL